jgi:hypothetical protein
VEVGENPLSRTPLRAAVSLYQRGRSASLSHKHVVSLFRRMIDTTAAGPHCKLTREYQSLLATRVDWDRRLASRADRGNLYFL